MLIKFDEERRGKLENGKCDKLYLSFKNYDYVKKCSVALHCIHSLNYIFDSRDRSVPNFLVHVPALVPQKSVLGSWY